MLNPNQDTSVIVSPVKPPGLFDSLFTFLGQMLGKGYRGAAAATSGVKAVDDQFSTLWWNTAQIPYPPPRQSGPAGCNDKCVNPQTKTTLYQIGSTDPTHLDTFDRAAQIVVLIKDSSTVRFATSVNELKQAIGGNNNGLALTSTNGPFPLFWCGELWAIGSSATSTFVLVEMV